MLIVNLECKSTHLLVFSFIFRFSNYGSSPEELLYALLPLGWDAEQEVKQELQCATASCFCEERGFLACYMVPKDILLLAAKILILLGFFFLPRTDDISC